MLRRLGWAALRIAILALAVYIWIGFVVSTSFGPRDPPERVVTPDAIGIIEDMETAEDGITTTLRLDDGEEVVVHHTRDLEAYGGRNVGFLLVTGSLGDARWNMFLRRDESLGPSACYALGGRPFDDGDHVVFPAGSPNGPYGIRLPKAPDFEADDPNRETQRYGSTETATFFCLNERGQVTGQGDLLRRQSE